MAVNPERDQSPEELFLMDDIDEAFRQNAGIVGIAEAIDIPGEENLPALMVLEGRLDEAKIDCEDPRIRITRKLLSSGPEAESRIEFRDSVHSRQVTELQMLLPRDLDPSRYTSLRDEYFGEDYKEEFPPEESEEQKEEIVKETIEAIREMILQTEWDETLSQEAAAEIGTKAREEYGMQ